MITKDETHAGRKASLYAGLSMQERAALFLALARLANASWRRSASKGWARVAYHRTLAFAPLLLCLIGAAAAVPTAPSKSPRCSVVYINGDAVISCPKGSR